MEIYKYIIHTPAWLRNRVNGKYRFTASGTVLAESHTEAIALALEKYPHMSDVKNPVVFTSVSSLGEGGPGAGLKQGDGK